MQPCASHGPAPHGDGDGADHRSRQLSSPPLEPAYVPDELRDEPARHLPGLVGEGRPSDPSPKTMFLSAAMPRPQCHAVDFYGDRPAHLQTVRGGGGWSCVVCHGPARHRGRPPGTIIAKASPERAGPSAEPPADPVRPDPGVPYRCSLISLAAALPRRWA